jgi:uncharacterized cupredoxin-like copper-binding protein
MDIKALIALSALATAPGLALAHGDAKPRAAISKEVHPWGREGDPAKATRTITIRMADTMRFEPDRLTLREGDTVTFVVANGGAQLHEMVIGTEDELKKHAELMKKHPEMEHDEPYMAHVAPGKRGTITWTFTRPGTFMYGCLIPGHWDAGMKGTVVVEPRKRIQPTATQEPPK